MNLYPRVLRHQSFRYLFLGQAASVIGDRVVVVALALFITQRTGSATDLGFVLGAQTLPLVALLLFGGVWADRLPRHRIMIATDLTRAALHATLAILIFTDAVRIWQIVAIEALFGAAQAFFQPAYSGLIPQTVPEVQIQDAKALTESMSNLAFLVGPALATALSASAPARRSRSTPPPSCSARRCCLQSARGELRRRPDRSCRSCARGCARSAPAAGFG